MFQSQSSFCRLPRELRDEVYSYYVREPDGYHHDSISNKLRTARNEPVDISLYYTCKIIATEMKGLALRENSITFQPKLDLPSSADQVPNAKRFNNLLSSHEIALGTMLSWAANCVTPEVLQLLSHRHADHHGLRWLQNLDQPTRRKSLQRGHIPMKGLPHNTANHRLLQDMVQIISKHHDFYELTAREYNLALRGSLIPPYDVPYDEDLLGEYIPDPPAYTEESQRRILGWSPEPWLIPSDAELDELDLLLPQANNAPEDDGDRDRGPLTEFSKEYFSATATAIQFLQQLDPQVRMHVRRVVIQEKHASGELQASHAQGLIPICQENPKLRVETRVDLWRIIMLQPWPFHARDPDFWTILKDIANWISEALCLGELGMPLGAFSLLFQGGTARLSQQMCDAVKRAAAIQDALEWNERIHPVADPHPLLINKISEDFPSDVRKIFLGNTPIRFDAHMGAPWDVEEVIQAQEQLGPFPDWWKDVFQVSSFDQPPQGWEAMGNEYTVQVDWLERMDGWETLLASV